MALLYRAQLVPTKLELLQAWVPAQPWLGAVDASTLEVMDGFRFDDPEGEVGIETLLVRAAGGEILQVSVTYRPAPLPEAEASLLGTAEHSVLGRRWVYDGCGDPVYIRALATAIATGGRQAELELHTETGLVRREPTARVQGSGTPQSPVPDFVGSRRRERSQATVLESGDAELVVVRVVSGQEVGAGSNRSQTLTGTWSGHDRPARLALLSARGGGGHG